MTIRSVTETGPEVAAALAAISRAGESWREVAAQMRAVALGGRASRDELAMMSRALRECALDVEAAMQTANHALPFPARIS